MEEFRAQAKCSKIQEGSLYYSQFFQQFHCKTNDISTVHTQLHNPRDFTLLRQAAHHTRHSGPQA